MFITSNSFEFYASVFDASTTHPDSKLHLFYLNRQAEKAVLSTNPPHGRSKSRNTFNQHFLSVISRHGEFVGNVDKATAKENTEILEVALPALVNWESTLEAWANVSESFDTRKIRLEFLNDCRVAKELKKTKAHDKTDGEEIEINPSEVLGLYFIQSDRDPIIFKKPEEAVSKAVVITHKLTSDGVVDTYAYKGLNPIPPLIRRVLGYEGIISNDEIDHDPKEYRSENLFFKRVD